MKTTMAKAGTLAADAPVRSVVHVADQQPYRAGAGAPPIGVASPGPAVPTAARQPGQPPGNRWQRPIFDHRLTRYGLSMASVALATIAMANVSTLAEKPFAFPFYAAVVISAWIGAGPGLVAVI